MEQMLFFQMGKNKENQRAVGTNVSKISRKVAENESMPPGSDEEADYAFICTNEQIQNILKTTPLQHFTYSQYLKCIGYICRTENTALTRSYCLLNHKEFTIVIPGSACRIDKETFQFVSVMTTFIVRGNYRTGQEEYEKAYIDSRREVEINAI